MTTVYIVTSGEYSDYSIDGAFSSEKQANEFIKVFGDGSVEPWQLDKRSKDANCPYWTACLDLATENIVSEGNDSEIADPNTRIGYVRLYDCASQAHPKGFIGAKSYVSQEHANKLCVEKRQELQR